MTHVSLSLTVLPPFENFYTVIQEPETTKSILDTLQSLLTLF